MQLQGAHGNCNRETKLLKLKANYNTLRYNLFEVTL